jgi:hypothetical protein
MKILHREHKGENETWETKAWMEEQAEFKHVKNMDRSFFISLRSSSLSFEYCSELFLNFKRNCKFVDMLGG